MSPPHSLYIGENAEGGVNPEPNDEPTGPVYENLPKVCVLQIHVPLLVDCLCGCCVVPCPALSHPALCCPALPCPALPCPALPCPALPSPALPSPALPSPALPFPAPPCPCSAILNCIPLSFFSLRIPKMIHRLVRRTEVGLKL